MDKAKVSDLFSKELFQKGFEPLFQSFYNFEFSDGYFMQMHSHDAIEIMYVRKGMCEVHTTDRQYRLDAGDFILINGFIPHKLVVARNLKCRVLCLEFIFEKNNDAGSIYGDIYMNSDEFRRFLLASECIIKLKDTMEVYQQLLDIYNELEHERKDRQVLIKNVFSQLLVKLARLYSESRQQIDSPLNKYIKEAVAFISANYHYDLSIDDIAAHIKLNVSYFYKIFKKATGQTPLEILNSIRINKAKMLLEKTEIPIIEICSFVGFNSRQYFSHIFRKVTGLTPSQYRAGTISDRHPVKPNNACRREFLSF